MKNGLFNSLKALILVLAVSQLAGCAGFTTLFEEGEDPAEYDRGYRAEAHCADASCDTETDAGFFRRAAAPVSDEEREVRRAIASRDVVVGMSRRDVASSWGEPVQREVAGNGSTGHERWTYGSRYSLQGARTVIFENGRVAGWNQ